MLTAAELQALPHGRVTRVTGLVTGRQRPGTASGVTFVTLEDETGMINVIVWRDLAERQRKELLRANLLTVYGTLEREGEVVHLIAGALARSDGAARQAGRALARFSLRACCSASPKPGARWRAVQGRRQRPARLAAIIGIHSSPTSAMTPALPVNVDAVAALLEQHDYFADRRLATSVYLALKMRRPLFLEGEAGVGKTEIAKVLAAALGRALIRLQCYEGLDTASAVYEWNYPRQMIEIRLAEASGKVDREDAGHRYLCRALPDPPADPAGARAA